MVFDTDVIIDLSDGRASAAAAVKEARERLLSVISYMELMRGARDSRERDAIKRFVEERRFAVLPLTEGIGQRASFYIEQYAMGARLGVTDALIAATAVEHGLTLCTGNYRHFRMIAGLALRPFRP